VSQRARRTILEDDKSKAGLAGDQRARLPRPSKAAQMMILNKMGLLPHVDFDPERALANALQVNPSISSIRLSARTGEGLEAWYEWLRHESSRARGQAFS
jgi:hydrogenase nickel incorporation protein HypB